MSDVVDVDDGITEPGGGEADGGVCIAWETDELNLICIKQNCVGVRKRVKRVGEGLQIESVN